MRHLKKYLLILPVLLLASACSKDTPSVFSPGSGGGGNGPILASPSEDQQLDTLRPTLTVTNSAATGGSGTRAYEFQVAPDTTFAALTFSKTGVPEGTAGKTSLAVDQDLPEGKVLYWRSRLTRGTLTSDWSPSGKFRTKGAVGHNIPGELFDPLTSGTTVGTISGNVTFIPGQGIRLNDAFAYVVYSLPQVLLTGELSVEVTGLGPGGPCCKVRVFSIIDSVGTLASSSPYSMNAQYRGVGGNPDNCICFKSVFGNNADGLEPTTTQRLNMSYVLDRSKVYLWRAVWTRDSYQLIVRENGTTGTPIYDFTARKNSANWNPSRMFAFLGTDNGKFDVLDGSLAGITLRNLWVGSGPRPATLGSSR